MQDYDFYKCEICHGLKWAGDEKVMTVAYSNKNHKAQGNEANLKAYNVLVCPKCRGEEDDEEEEEEDGS